VSSRTHDASGGTGSWRIIAPKPSMIAISVSIRTSGSRTPSRSMNFACSTLGRCGGMISRGMS
jgi:hypothetical protein